MSKYFEQSIMTFVMLAIFVLMVGMSFNYPPAARFMVLVIGAPAITLCLVQLGVDYYRHEEIEAGRQEPDARQLTQASDGTMMSTSSSPLASGDYSPATAHKELVLWVYFLSLIAGILLFGFNATVPVFLFTFLLSYARVSLRRAAIYTAVAAFFLYVLFNYIFRMPLHGGFVTDRLMDLISG